MKHRRRVARQGSSAGKVVGQDDVERIPVRDQGPEAVNIHHQLKGLAPHRRLNRLRQVAIIVQEKNNQFEFNMTIASHHNIYLPIELHHRFIYVSRITENHDLYQQMTN
ncbi:hypothetical protein [Paludibacterium sp.]|uniref:hypothetical protein n=1 Tax=Paludibacterium sp. TaxID=1917523 RepID=UPI0025FD3247|nr:hypothetical protein [Paludibacterium sp.]